MKHINLLKAIPLSFYSKELYQEVAKLWRGRSFVYLLVVLAICLLFSTAAKTNRILNRILNNATQISQQMPVIHFEKGVASTVKEGPFFIKAIKNGKVTAIIDAKNKFKNFRDSSAIILVQKNAVHVKHGKANVSVYNYSKTFGGDFGHEQFKRMLSKSKFKIYMLSYAVFYLLGLIFLYLSYIFLVLIYSVIGLIFVNVFDRKLSYASVMSMGLVAVTPAIVFYMLLALFNLNFKYEYFVGFLLSMLYVIYAVKCNPEK